HGGRPVPVLNRGEQPHRPNVAPAIGARSGKEALSPTPPPLRTARAPFRRMQLKHRATSLRDTTRFGSAGRRHPLRDAVAPLGLGVNLSGTAAEPATEMSSVAAGAPARVLATPPTDLHPSLRRLADGSRPPTPEGSQPACAGG